MRGGRRRGERRVEEEVRGQSVSQQLTALTEVIYHNQHIHSNMDSQLTAYIKGC